MTTNMFNRVFFKPPFCSVPFSSYNFIIIFILGIPIFELKYKTEKNNLSLKQPNNYLG